MKTAKVMWCLYLIAMSVALTSFWKATRSTTLDRVSMIRNGVCDERVL